MQRARLSFMFDFQSMRDLDGTGRGSDRNAVPSSRGGNVRFLRPIPGNTLVRERLDGGDPNAPSHAFRNVFSRLQRGYGPKGTESIDDDCPISTNAVSWRQFHPERGRLGQAAAAGTRWVRNRHRRPTDIPNLQPATAGANANLRHMQIAEANLEVADMKVIFR